MNVNLDTSVVLKSMVDQARMVVLKAVASATDTPVNMAAAAIEPPISQVAIVPPVSAGESTRTAVYAPAKESARLQKARTSALRLNSVLHGKPLAGSVSSLGLAGQPDVGIRKVRSVRWDHPAPAPKLTSALAPTPNLDKVRMVQSSNKLKSFKSFGRPHAGDFGSGPHNATFGEYGRPANAGTWGRDGRLAAHPTPGLNSAVDDRGNLVGGSADLNATFDTLLSRNSGSAAGLPPSAGLQRGESGGSRSAAASAGAAMLGRSAVPSSGGGFPHKPTTGLPRTATALEQSLIKKWM